MKRPPLEGLVETALYVTDVKRSRDFYVGIFGFEPMGGDERIQSLAVREGQVLLLFRQGATRRPIPIGGGFIPPHDGAGEQHFAFGIELEVYEDWKTFIQGLHIGIQSEVAWPHGGRSLYFRDPDRLVVELVTRGVWKNF
jgi:catechol 2,3-dioxygenase-like lactoylglutathione lyase family enzyme